VSTAPQALPSRPVRRSPWAIVRGVVAVALLIAGALDALVSAWLGTPRLGWLARRAAAACVDEYRLRASGAVDAIVVSDVADGQDDAREEPAAAGGQDPDKEGAA
jgi:hypothetical protein